MSSRDPTEVIFFLDGQKTNKQMLNIYYLGFANQQSCR